MSGAHAVVVGCFQAGETHLTHGGLERMFSSANQPADEADEDSQVAN